MAALTIFFTLIAGLIALFAAAVYFFGVPAEWKEKAMEAAAKNMGENAATDLVKDQIGKLPDKDEKKVDDAKKALGDVTDGKLPDLLK